MGFPIFLIEFSTPISEHDVGHQILCSELQCRSRLVVKGKRGLSHVAFPSDASGGNLHLPIVFLFLPRLTEELKPYASHP